MKAHTITTMTRRRRNARRCVIALALAAVAPTIPASASPERRPDDSSAGRSTAAYQTASVQPPHGANYSSVTGSPADEPTLVSGTPLGAADGFDWGDAALGAGVAMALVAFGGAAVFTVRRRSEHPGVSPSASTG